MNENARTATIVHHVGRSRPTAGEAQGILASAQATVERKEKASRDVAALRFALEEVKHRPQKSGEGKAEKVFSSSSLQSGGLIGIGIFGGGKVPAVRERQGQCCFMTDR